MGGIPRLDEASAKCFCFAGLTSETEGETARAADCSKVFSAVLFWAVLFSAVLFSSTFLQFTQIPNGYALPVAPAVLGLPWYILGSPPDNRSAATGSDVRLFYAQFGNSSSSNHCQFGGFHVRVVYLAWEGIHPSPLICMWLVLSWRYVQRSLAIDRRALKYHTKT